MSDHYEWVLALRLIPDTPKPLLEELRYHLGLSPQQPDEPTLDYDVWDRPYQCLAADPEGRLPGGEFTSFIEQRPDLNRPPVWGLFIRRLILDDELGLTGNVLEWLAPWSMTQGWVGFVREELALRPWLNLYIQNGYAYLARDAASIKPTHHSRDAPPFTLIQTTDDFGDRSGQASGETPM